MSGKKTLLEKYGIPIGHLDFEYIENCKNAREMEKIVHILRSGEEGYFPDLTKCAEGKLLELKPDSRHFRLEHQIERGIDSTELDPIVDWNRNIKNIDNHFQKLSLKSGKCAKQMQENYPPIRERGKISTTSENAEKKVEKGENKATGNKQKPVASTDYAKWDKFDADDEILRLDLQEEREQEVVERKKNELKAAKIEEITEPVMEDRNKLTKLEKELLAEQFRVRGNEYFRAKEFKNAKADYTRAIDTAPYKAAAAYNNRAITNIKLKLYDEAIRDCNKCLHFEPKNVKALLRLAEAHILLDKKRIAREIYCRVLEVDSENYAAKRGLLGLQLEIGEQPPSTATHYAIEESQPIDAKPKNSYHASLSQIASNINKKFQIQESKAKPSTKEYDFAELVRPNRIAKNKLLSAAEMMTKLQKPYSDASECKASAPDPPPEPEESFAFRMPTLGTAPTKGKPLIEELN